MKIKFLHVFSAAAILLGSAVTPAVVSALTMVTITPIVKQNPGQTITITGSSYHPEVVVKVLTPTNTVLYMDALMTTANQYSTTFTLPQDAAVGTYTIVAGKDREVATRTFDVEAASTGGGGGGSTTPTTPTTPTNPTPGTSPLVDADPQTGGKFEIETPKDTVSQEVQTDGKRTVVKATVDNGKLIDYIKQSLPAAGTSTDPKQKVVVVEVKGEADAVETGLIVNTFNTLKDKEKTAAVEIKSSFGSITIPALSVSEQAKALGLQGEAPVSVKVTKTTAQTQQQMEDLFEQTGSESLVTPVDFKIEAKVGDKTVELNQFDSYIEHTLSLPSAQKDTNIKHMAGVMFDAEKGSYYPMPTWFTKKTDGDVDGTILRKGNSIYTIVKNVKTFSDIDNSYAKETIETLASKFVVGGYGDGTFLPSNKVNRAEFATLLIRSLGILPDQAPTTGFSDVKPTDWYAGTVSAAAKAGLIKGYEDNTFHPEREVSRQEMVQMIYNAMKTAGYSKTVTAEEKAMLLSRFGDQQSVPAWASEAVAVSVQEGIVSGMEDNTFTPTGKADRAQGATVLYRMMKALKFIN